MPAPPLDLELRLARPADHPAIADVVAAAFGRRSDAALVELLRGRGDALEQVATRRGELLAHALFVPVELVGPRGARPPLALGLMAVAPAHQREGIGRAVVVAGLAECRRRGAGLVVVIGPGGFYGRCGFVPAEPHGLRSRWRVVPDDFRVVELHAGELAAARGSVVRFVREFSQL